MVWKCSGGVEEVWWKCCPSHPIKTVGIPMITAETTVDGGWGVNLDGLYNAGAGGRPREGVSRSVFQASRHGGQKTLGVIGSDRKSWQYTP